MNHDTQNYNTIQEAEERLAEWLKRVEELETEIAKREKDARAQEKAIKEKEKARKQILLRLAPSLWQELASWAEEDFRSINGQIEYLLTECVKKRKN